MLARGHWAWPLDWQTRIRSSCTRVPRLRGAGALTRTPAFLRNHQSRSVPNTATAGLGYILLTPSLHLLLTYPFRHFLALRPLVLFPVRYLSFTCSLLEPRL